MLSDLLYSMIFWIPLCISYVNTLSFLLVPWIWRNLPCLVYLCPIGKKNHLCLNFVFQYMRPWKYWKGNCCLCSSRYRGFLLIVLSIKLKRFYLRINLSISGPKQETFSFITFVFSITFIKSVASLRCGLCNYDIGCSNVPVSTKEEVLSVRPSDES